MSAEISRIRIDVARLQEGQAQAEKRLDGMEGAVAGVPVQGSKIDRVQQDVTELRQDIKGLDRKMTGLKGLMIGGVATVSCLLPIVWKVIEVVVSWMKG